MILVIAHNVMKGGGINIVASFLEYLKNEKITFVAILPRVKTYEDIAKDTSTLKVIWFPSDLSRFLYKIIFPFFLRKITLKYGVSKIYSLGNMGYDVDIPQSVLVQNAFSTLKDERVWNKFSLSNKIYLKLMQKTILSNLKYAKRVLVQTETEKRNLLPYLRKDATISIVPNSLDLEKLGRSPESESIFDGSKLDLLFLSKYYPQKNFEILPEVCKIILERNLPITISLTLNRNNKTERKILDSLNTYSSVVKNLGYVNYSDLSNVYSKHDGIFLPTLLESFTANYIEALYFKKLIFTSDRDFAREVCDDCAFYFDPYSAISIVNEFEKVLRFSSKATQKMTGYKNHLNKLNVLDAKDNNLLIYNSI